MMDRFGILLLNVMMNLYLVSSPFVSDFLSISTFANSLPLEHDIVRSEDWLPIRYWSVVDRVIANESEVLVE